MKTIKDLELFIQFEIPPQYLSNEQQVKELQQKWTVFCRSGCPDNPGIWGGKKDNVRVLLDQLVQMNNEVQGYLYRQHRLWKHFKFAPLIKTFYREVDGHLKELLRSCLLKNPALRDDVALTNDERAVVIQQLMEKFRDMEKVLHASGIETSLVQAVTKPIFTSIRKSVLNVRTVAQLKALMDHLINTSGLNEADFKIILFQHDYNVPEVFMYWINGWERLLAEEPDLHEQLEFVIREQDQLRQLRSLDHNRFIGSEASLKEELMGYLKEKKETLKELIKLRRAKIKDSQLSKLIIRIRTTLPVAQLALFIRLQIEKGILAKEHVGRIFSFYATHFYNSQTEHISAESLQKKSSDVEYATAQKFKAQLIGMVNWLNEHFKIGS